MNNKGWGLAEMLILSSILIIALIIASVNAKKLNNNIDGNNNHIYESKKEEQINTTTQETNDTQNTDLTPYKSIESKMITNAQGFVNNGSVIIGQDIIIVKDIHLYEQDEDLKNKMNTNNCKGYIRIYNENNTIYYVPYINCDKYTTDGYENIYN